MLLLTKYSDKAQPSSQALVINVQLQKTSPVEPAIPSQKVTQSSTKKASIEPLERKPRPTEVIKSIANNSDDKQVDETLESKLQNNTIISISDFRALISQEAVSYIKKNSKLIDEVDNTFEYKTNKQAESSGNTPAAVMQASRTGVGKTITKDGRHLCYAVIYDLSQPQAGESRTWQDCTPKKKFILDLNAPDNG